MVHWLGREIRLSISLGDVVVSHYSVQRVDCMGGIGIPSGFTFELLQNLCAFALITVVSQIGISQLFVLSLPPHLTQEWSFPFIVEKIG